MNKPVHASNRSTLLTLALAAALFASGEAHAQQFPTTDVGDWTVAANRDNTGCFITKTYPRPGETTVLLGLNTDGSNHLTVLNENWSIESQERLELRFELSRGDYTDHPVVGMASGGKRGFVTSFESEFPAYFAASRALHIYRGDVPVEQLSLDGSSNAVTELRRCVAMIAAEPAATPREDERSDAIPKDPFARDARRRSRD